jgi:Family of unknown function (DUF5681)
MPFRVIKRPQPMPPSPAIDPIEGENHDSLPIPDAEPANYAIGYGRPPKHTQFKKGQSGNSKGRKKGSKGLMTIVREAMLQKVSVRTAQGEKRMTRAEATFAKMLEKGFAGDARALAIVLGMYRDAVPDEPSSASDTSGRSTESDDKIIAEFLRLSSHLGPSASLPNNEEPGSE